MHDGEGPCSRGDSIGTNNRSKFGVRNWTGTVNKRSAELQNQRAVSKTILRAMGAGPENKEWYPRIESQKRGRGRATIET